MLPEIIVFAVFKIHVIFFSRVVTVKCMDWSSSSREIALSTVMGSLVLMFGNSFVFGVVTVLFTIGIVSSGEIKSGPGWLKNSFD